MNKPRTAPNPFLGCRSLHHKANVNPRQLQPAMFGFVIIACILGALLHWDFITVTHTAAAGGTLMAVTPFAGAVVLDEPMPEKEFQETVLNSTKAVENRTKAIEDQSKGYKTQMDQIASNYDQLDKTTKKAIEDFQKARDAYEGSANQHSDAVNSLTRMVKAYRNEQGLAFPDPIKRISSDDELKARFNAMIRKATIAGANGKFDAQVKAITKALGEDSSPGSTLINDELSSAIYDTLTQYGSWNTLEVEDMGTKTEKIPVDTADPVANFILTEAGAISDDTNIAGTQVSLTAEVLAVMLYVSEQLLQDAEYDVTGNVLRKMRNAFAKRMDYAAFVADGTSDATNGGFTGLFEFGTAKAAASGNTTVESLDFEDFTGTLLTPDEEVLNRDARWWIHQHMLIRALSVKDSNGRPIFLTANEAPTPGGIGTILGYPVTLVPIAPKTNSASGKVAAFGDPSAFCVGLRRDFQFDQSVHHRFANLQQSFRGYGRAGFKGKRAEGVAVLTLAAS